MSVSGVPCGSAEPWTLRLKVANIESEEKYDGKVSIGSNESFICSSGVSANVVGKVNGQLKLEIVCACMELSLLPQDKDELANDAHNFLLMLGLPLEVTAEELQIYLDPFIEELDGLCVFKLVRDVRIPHSNFASDASNTSSNSRSKGGTTVCLFEPAEECQKHLLLFFKNASSSQGFAELYNNNQIPSYREHPPCVIVRPRSLQCDGFLSAIHEQTECIEGASPIQRRARGGLHLLHKYSQLAAATTNTPDIPTATASANEDLSMLESSELRVIQQHQVQEQQRHLRLPTCSICLRRVRNIADNAAMISADSLLQHVAEIRIGRGYKWNPIISAPPFGSTREQSSTRMMCVCCFLYNENDTDSSALITTTTARSCSNSSAELSTKRGVSMQRNVGCCVDCGLSTNVWLCLCCGHTGCGRYTSQHAHQHYLLGGGTNSGSAISSGRHHLTLELASGRIWNYFADSFQYFEDSEMAVILGTRELRHSRENGLTLPTAEISPIDGNLCSSRQMTGPSKNCSSDSEAGTWLTAASFAGKQSHFHTTHSSICGMSNNVNYCGSDDTFAAQLDSLTQQKISAMLVHYERVLETQVHDQMLHYEKLLARETVRALEVSFQQFTQAQHPQRKTGEIGELGSVSHSDPTIDSGRNNSSSNDGMVPNEENVAAHSALQEIAQLKIAISSAELQYRKSLDDARHADEESLKLKKENDALISNQKKQRALEAEFKSRAVEARRLCSERVADMEQQISDLVFYAKTRQQTAESSLRDEIQQGFVYTSPSPQCATNSGSDGGKSGPSKRGGSSKSNSSSFSKSEGKRK